MTPRYINNCSSVQKCPFRTQALAPPYAEIPCTIEIHMMSDFTGMHTEFQCLAINIFGNTYMQVFMWMDGRLRRERERAIEADGIYI